jgi:hypothetical protein
LPLTSITGLDNLTSIGGNLFIAENTLLNSLIGLDNLTSITGGLSIEFNDSLTSLTGLENLTSITGYLWLQWNGSLTSLAGLDNVTSISGSGGVSIYGTNLINMTGIENLSSIGGSFSIGGYDGGNPALTSLTGLESLISIGSYLNIRSSPLVSLMGLSNLNSIGGGLGIEGTALTSLAGLDNLDAGSISELSIIYNNSLSTCALQSICDYLASPNGTVEIHDNAPACNSPEEVDSACVYLSTDEINPQHTFSISPNPTSTTITISTPTTPEKNTTLTIFNINGQALLSRQITEQQTVVDVSGLPQGVYFVRVRDDRTMMVSKFIKSDK